jgi:hypothetical protein
MPSHRLDVFAGNPLVLLHQIVHRRMHPGQIVARNAGTHAAFRAAGIEHGVEFGVSFRNRLVDADIDVGMERDALAFHLLDTPVDIVLFHLEIGNAVAQQTADPAFALEDVHVVPGASKLLRGGHARRTGADDRNLFAGLALRPAAARSRPIS